MRPHLRFAVVCLLLTGTALFLRSRGAQEVFPPRQQLSSFPHELGPWRGTDVALSKGVLDILGDGDFLSRVYQDRLKTETYVGLFMAYFPSQRMGSTIHSPRNCLPGSGWAQLESSRIRISLPGYGSIPANRSVVAKGAERQLVLYWYWAHDRAVASEYWAKFYLIADSVRLNRSDGSLIRLTTPVASDEAPDSAEQRLLSFAGEVVPLIKDYAPR
jgi:EpsI family protein